MQQGMYNLTSEMISQQRNLDVIGHNMTNISTAGHRSDRMVFTTFKDEMIYRTGNKDKNNDVPIGHLAMLKTMDESYTYFGEKGTYDVTGLPLDFAMKNNGFFQIDTGQGIKYTRAGSFIIDDDGYLALPEEGRVLDRNKEPVFLSTDDITADSEGNIFDKFTHEKLADIGIVDFEDYHRDLKKDNDGMFIAQGNAQPQNVDNPDILWQYVELSNTNMADEMVKMIASERALQSSAQILKMYDGLTGRMVNDIGKI